MVLTRLRVKVHHGFAYLMPLLLKSKTLWICLTLALLPTSSGADSGRPNATFEEYTTTSSHEKGGKNAPAAPCTVQQLLPVSATHDGQPGGWVEQTNETRPAYDCSCPYYKARYFCNNIPQDSLHWMWHPPSVASGQCELVQMDVLRQNLLPDDFTVLVFANSHGRQLVESLLCQFSDQVVSRNVTTSDTPAVYESHRQELIGLDQQCRGMSTWGRKELLQGGCIDEDDVGAFKCKDGRASFHFRNGATIHYRFSDMPNKDIDREMAGFGLAPDNVDVIMANRGNNADLLPRWKLQKTAKSVQQYEVLVLWLTMYGGEGYYRDKHEQHELADVGVVQVDLGIMGKAEQVQPWRTKIDLQSYTADRHFCMPGPADEIGLLIVQMVWAHYLGRTDS